MGTSRTIKALLERYVECERDEEVPTNNRKTLDQWAWKFNWTERIREWDAEEERRRLEYLEKTKRDKWEKDVEAYRDRNKRLGSAIFEVVVLLVNEASLAVKEDPKAKMTLDQAFRGLGLVSRLAETSQSTEGTALGVTQLLEEMNCKNE
jgi:DNA repair photolyase